MAIVISGVNNNDKITASDGTIDLLSGVNFNSELTVPSFKVGNNIQLGNAGVATATTFVGNLTGNVNATSNLLLQIGGSEKFRVASSGQLGIGGANYGTSGQVLTSGGSGSAATWSTITGTTINNNADNRLITGSGSANTLEGESALTYNNNILKNEVSDASGLTAHILVNNSESSAGVSLLGSGSSFSSGGWAPVTDAGIIRSSAGAANGLVLQAASGNLLFHVDTTERVRIDSNGKLTMSSGTVELESHMIRVGNRTTSQINAGVSTSTGSLTLDTSDNNLKYYANAQWNTVKKSGNDGSTQQLAARSAKALLDDGITSNGVYWLDMHGAYSLGNAKLHYCLMDSSYDGGGWTMLYSMNHGNNFASGSNYSFSVNVGNPTTINDFTAGNWGYDRRNTFTPAANDQFLIRRSDNNDWKRFVVSNWSPTDNSISNGWETLRLPNGSNTGHPQWATGQMYDSSGNAVSGHIYFNGCAKGGNCNSGGGDGSGFGNYSQWLDAVGNSAFGGGYNSQSNGGSPLYWGQGNALSQGGSLYIQMFYRKAGTQ